MDNQYLLTNLRKQLKEISDLIDYVESNKNPPSETVTSDFTKDPEDEIVENLDEILHQSEATTYLQKYEECGGENVQDIKNICNLEGIDNEEYFYKLLETEFGIYKVIAIIQLNYDKINTIKSKCRTLFKFIECVWNNNIGFDEALKNNIGLIYSKYNNKAKLCNVRKNKEEMKVNNIQDDFSINKHMRELFYKLKETLTDTWDQNAQDCCLVFITSFIGAFRPCEIQEMYIDDPTKLNYFDTETKTFVLKSFKHCELYFKKHNVDSITIELEKITYLKNEELNSFMEVVSLGKGKLLYSWSRGTQKEMKYKDATSIRNRFMPMLKENNIIVKDNNKLRKIMENIMSTKEPVDRFWLSKVHIHSELQGELSYHNASQQKEEEEEEEAKTKLVIKRWEHQPDTREEALNIIKKSIYGFGFFDGEREYCDLEIAEVIREINKNIFETLMSTKYKDYDLGKVSKCQEFHYLVPNASSAKIK